MLTRYWIAEQSFRGRGCKMSSQRWACDFFTFWFLNNFVQALNNFQRVQREAAEREKQVRSINQSIIKNILPSEWSFCLLQATWVWPSVFKGLAAAKQNDNSWALAGPGEDQQQQGQSRSWIFTVCIDHNNFLTIYAICQLRSSSLPSQNPADDRGGGENWPAGAAGAEHASAGVRYCRREHHLQGECPTQCFKIVRDLWFPGPCNDGAWTRRDCG